MKLIVLFISLTTLLFSHSGRTDASGGHTNSKTGEYHYHNKQSGSSPSANDGKSTVNVSDKSLVRKFINNRTCDQVIDKRYYQICYDYKAKGARAVAYTLDGDKVSHKNIEKRPRFYDELVLPKQYRSHYKDYTKNPYDMDRGHLAPDASFDWSQRSLKSTYSMANVIPQYKNINRYSWIKAEKLERMIARKLGSVTVINGVNYRPNPKRIGRSQIAVPNSYYKILVNKDQNYSRCFFYKNTIGLSTAGDKLRNHEVECKNLLLK